MKPAPFAYAAPASLADAVALLAQHGAAARPISGGQSLMPVLNFRLAAPDLLVDLRNIPGLDRIVIDDAGVHLGARVRWCDIERDPRLASAHPLLAAAIAHVAHYQIRARGTVGGSLAHADPASEMPGIAVTCDAIIDLIGPNGTRSIKAADFVIGPLTTSLAEAELISAVHLPPWPASRRWAFEEFARRQGDFALAGVAAFWDPDDKGRAGNVHLGVIGACSHAQRLTEAEAALEGHVPDADHIAIVVDLAAQGCDPSDDLHAPAAYRRALLATLCARALARAAA